MIDFNRFAIELVVAALMERLSIINAVASNGEFARQIFKAYSATAQVRVIARLCVAEVVEVS